jgi:4-aminobutyrate aminotransferase/4-aminobutyrate aminotransferase/(S)-3-amino-2-methylpropionate transaminase
MFDMIGSEEILTSRRALLDGWGGRPQLIITRAKGAKIWDSQGKEYIDCTSQAFVLNIGANHLQVIEAVKKQLEKATHIAYHLDSAPLLLLTRKLTQIAPAGLNRVNFCLEGSLAAESAMKLALKNCPGCKYFIVFEHGFHGRNLLTMAASWADPRNSFSYFKDRIIRVPEAYCYRCKFGLSYPSCNLECAAFLEKTIEKEKDAGIIALMMEPVQGNGGQIPFPPEFHRKVREICDRQRILLIWDEIQTGFGRVGTMFAAELYEVVPDILVFGKAAAGGFPLAGILVRDNLRGFDAGENAFTFAHFPLSLVAALATIKVLEEGKLLERCNRLNQRIIEHLQSLQEKYEIIGDVRGPGLAIGIELVKDRDSKEPAVKEANEVVRLGLERGIMFGISKYGGLGNVLKIKPPLVINDEEVEKVLSVFEECIVEVQRKSE